ncbi:MAG: NmrA/HSCARG family protein [Bryobacteraceae bacterium]
MSKPILAVVGATGAQGGGLARAIAADASGLFQLRAITRHPNKAAAFSGAGAEVVAASADEPASLATAFEGAYGAFLVTNFWEHFSPEREVRQASNLAKAVRDAGVKHVIWSTLEDSRKFVPLDDNRMPTLMGKYKVPHFDAKGEADEVFRELGVPTTFLLTSFYWDNFIHFGMGPRRGPDGRYAIALPMGDERLPGIAAEDIGRCALGVFRAGDALIGKTVGVAGEHLSGAEMAAGLAKALGIEVVYNALEPEVYRGFGFPGAEDLGNMFQFNRDFASAFQAARDVTFSRSLNPALHSFASWLEANSQRIPTE